MGGLVKNLIAAAVSFVPVGSLISNQVQAALAELDLRANTPGDVKYVAYNTAPAGWLKANGALVSRTAYAGLFAKIGTTYGAGDGSTTFALPDLRGEFVRGWDDARGVDASRAIGSAQADAFQGHKHTIDLNNSGSFGYGPTGTGTAGTTNYAAQATNSIMTDGTNGTPRAATETRPRNVALLAVIKY